MTQGYLLSPTIFNVVVDAVVRNWVTVMVKGAEERGNCGKYFRHQNTLLYSDNRMIALSETHGLQGAFINIVGMFDRVGLRTNVGKTVGMVFRPCQAL